MKHNLIYESERLEERLMRKMVCWVIFGNYEKHYQRWYRLIIKAAARSERRRSNLNDNTALL